MHRPKTQLVQPKEEILSQVDRLGEWFGGRHYERSTETEDMKQKRDRKQQELYSLRIDCKKVENARTRWVLRCSVTEVAGVARR